jgi:hypothetical protein
MYVPIVIDNINKLVFIVPPKNGCSTVRVTVDSFLYPKKKFDKNSSYDDEFYNTNLQYINSDLKEFKIMFIYRNITQGLGHI